MKVVYKRSEPRYSEYHKHLVFDVYKKGKLLWIFPFFWNTETIHFHSEGLADEIIFLKNNPDIMKQRLQDGVKLLKEKGIWK